MASRVALAALAIAAAGILVADAPARTPPVGVAMFVVQPDPRLCPSPRCGGYWAALANGARTRCGDGARRPRCYVAKVVDRRGRPLAGSFPDGALVRAVLEPGTDLDLDRLRVWASYAPAGTAPSSGGWYRVHDTGVRCVRAPCFSYRATQVNGATRVPTSAIDLAASNAGRQEQLRARAALESIDGLYAQGRFAPSADGGRVFRALRLYLREPLPRA